MSETIRIEEPHLLLVEGTNDQHFLEALIRKLSVDPVQVVRVFGKNNYSGILQTLVMAPNFKSTVRRLGVIRDNDNDPDAAFKSIKSALEKNGLPCPKHPEAFTAGKPPIVGVFLIPGRGKEGCLEDLCLSTRRDHPTMACVEKFMVCVGDRMNTEAPDAPADDKAYGYPKNETKARAHAFLASMPESDKTVGIAAEEGYWKMDHPVLKDLSKFLRTLTTR
ncbi:MAG: hypothetical protein IH987_11010 [Planctomycetes bacterium]|nr:hypothetical protein [Planctomycetota bacterium]